MTTRRFVWGLTTFLMFVAGTVFGMWISVPPPLPQEWCGTAIFRNIVMPGDSPPAPICVIHDEDSDALFLFNPENLEQHIRILPIPIDEWEFN